MGVGHRMCCKIVLFSERIYISWRRVSQGGQLMAAACPFVPAACSTTIFLYVSDQKLRPSTVRSLGPDSRLGHSRDHQFNCSLPRITNPNGLARENNTVLPLLLNKYFFRVVLSDFFLKKTLMNNTLLKQIPSQKNLWFGNKPIKDLFG